MRRYRFAWMLVALSCAHGPKHAPPASLKPVAEQFLERIRWKDFFGASDLVVPERRDAFRKARLDGKDERDLSISEYELDRLELSPDATRAKVYAHLKWVKLPSMSEHEEVVVSEFVDYQGTWLLARLENGPFDELTAAYERPDAGL